MTRETYELAEFEILLFNTEDVITTSDFIRDDNETERP